MKGLYARNEALLSQLSPKLILFDRLARRMLCSRTGANRGNLYPVAADEHSRAANLDGAAA
jgi:hypothetical protein